MPTFLIPVIEWLANYLLGKLVALVTKQLAQHQKAADADAQDKAALAKLAAAQSTADRIQAAKDALNGL